MRHAPQASQGYKLSKILQWAYDLEIDVEFTATETLNAVHKRLPRLTFRKGSKSISHVFNNLADSEEIEYFANQAAIKLLVKDLDL